MPDDGEPGRLLRDVGIILPGNAGFMREE